MWLPKSVKDYRCMMGECPKKESCIRYEDSSALSLTYHVRWENEKDFSCYKEKGKIENENSKNT